MEKKIQRAVLSLYAVAVIQVLSFAYSIYMHSITVSSYGSFVGHGFSSYAFLGPAFFWAGCMVAAIYKTAPNLRKQEPWAWAAAVLIFMVAIPSFAIPAAVVGLLSLFDEDLRGHFIKALDIKI